MNFKNSIVTQVDNYFVASNPKTGALSVFSNEEYLIFNMIRLSDIDANINDIARFYEKIGYDFINSQNKSASFLTKVTEDSWLDTEMKEKKEEYLQLVYLNLTQACNFNCPYCYQGNTHLRIHMDEESFNQIVLKIKAINPECHIIITGGEPLLHPKFIPFINYLEAKKVQYSLLTNASLLDKQAAEVLSKCKYLKKVQVSLDGTNAEIHKITRGDTFMEVIKGILLLINYHIPFSIAPTVHDLNVEEVYDIAKFAFENKGDISPNNLRYVPDNKMSGLYLSPENLVKSLNLIRKAKTDSINLNPDFGKMVCKDCEIGFESGKNLVCGLGHTIFNIDVNGDIYPCHVLSGNEFKLGNILTDNFDRIIEKVSELNIRTKSTDIEKCRNCHFVSTCHGGCRADSYFLNKTFYHPDSLCDTIYKFQMNNLIQLRTGHMIESHEYSLFR